MLCLVYMFLKCSLRYYDPVCVLVYASALPPPTLHRWEGLAC